MSIKSINSRGSIPNNLRAEQNLSELSFEGHSRPINSTAYTNKLNDPKTGELFGKYYGSIPFTTPRDYSFDSNGDFLATDRFESIDFKGDFIVAGVPGYSTVSTDTSSTGWKTGVVFIYTKDGKINSILESPDNGSFALFGTSVAYDLGSKKLFVGAIRHHDNSSGYTSSGGYNSGGSSLRTGEGGIVYVYDWDGSPKGPGDWGTPTTIQASDRVLNQDDHFGYALIAINNKLIVTARKGGPNGYGKVYTYNYDGSGEVGIVPSDSYYSTASSNIQFGNSIDADGNSTDGYKMIVGCQRWGNTAFVYDLDGTNEVKITPQRDGYLNPPYGTTYNDSISRAARQVAIDVSAGKVFIASPGYKPYAAWGGYWSNNSTDSGGIFVLNLDGTGQIVVSGDWTGYTIISNAKVGNRLAVDRQNQKIYTTHSRGAIDLYVDCVLVMNYDGTQKNTYIPNQGGPPPLNGNGYPFGIPRKPTEESQWIVRPLNSPTNVNLFNPPHYPAYSVNDDERFAWVFFEGETDYKKTVFDATFKQWKVYDGVLVCVATEGRKSSGLTTGLYTANPNNQSTIYDPDYQDDVEFGILIKGLSA